MTTTCVNFEIIDPEIKKALAILENPALTVCRPIEKGEMSGKFDLHNSVFRPHGKHPNEFPATCTFNVDGWVTFEAELMVMSYTDMMSSTFTLIGFIRHDQWDQIRSRVPIPFEHRIQLVAVRYNTVSRSGGIYIPRETYEFVEIYLSEQLYRMRRMKSGS